MSAIDDGGGGGQVGRRGINFGNMMELSFKVRHWNVSNCLSPLLELFGNCVPPVLIAFRLMTPNSKT